MLRSPPLRGVLLLAVLLAQVGLLFYGGATLSGSADPENHIYPSTIAVAGDYDRYVGQRVDLRLVVTSTDPLVATREFGDRRLRVTVEGLDVDVEPGDRIAVFGVAEAGGTVRAIDGYVVPSWGLYYTYIVSAIAGVWVLVRILRHWAVDRRTLGLAPRGGRDA